TAFDQRDPSSRIVETPAASARRYYLAWHGHHARRRRPLVPADHSLRHRSVRWRHGDLELPERSYERDLPFRRHRRHSQLRLPVRLQATRNGTAARVIVAAWRTTPGPRLKLSSGEASGRLRRDPCAGAAEGREDAAGDGGRR